MLSKDSYTICKCQPCCENSGGNGRRITTSQYRTHITAMRTSAADSTPVVRSSSSPPPQSNPPIIEDPKPVDFNRRLTALHTQKGLLRELRCSKINPKCTEAISSEAHASSSASSIEEPLPRPSHSRPHATAIQQSLLSRPDRRKKRAECDDEDQLSDTSTTINSLSRIHCNFSRGGWTNERAFGRYIALSRYFDSVHFVSIPTPTFLDFPWPILSRTFEPSYVQWEEVERFCRAMRKTMTDIEYLVFLDKSFRRFVIFLPSPSRRSRYLNRFHPDRWAARKLATSHIDSAILQAGNRVAQSLSNLVKQHRSSLSN